MSSVGDSVLVLGVISASSKIAVVSAAIVVGLLYEMSLKELNEFANEVASFVCSQKGGTPKLSKKLKNWIKIN